MDPSLIGRTVNFKFSQEVVPTTTYTINDLLSDAVTVSSWELSPFDLVSEILDLAEELFNDGTTEFIQDGKAVVFANLDGSNVDIDDSVNKFHENAASNGVIFVGSNEVDKATATDYKLEFYGFGGADEVTGSAEDDKLYGHSESGENDDCKSSASMEQIGVFA